MDTLLHFPGWPALWQMTMTALWWAVAIVAALVILAAIFVILALILRWLIECYT